MRARLSPLVTVLSGPSLQKSCAMQQNDGHLGLSASGKDMPLQPWTMHCLPFLLDCRICVPRCVCSPLPGLQSAITLHSSVANKFPRTARAQLTFKLEDPTHSHVQPRSPLVSSISEWCQQHLISPFPLTADSSCSTCIHRNSQVT